MAVIVVIAIIVIFLAHRFWRRYCFRREALLALRGIKQASGSAGVNRLSQLNKLLKQIAMTACPNHAVANLQGQAWLRFLDKTGKTDAFSTGVGSLLMTAPYQKMSSSRDFSKNDENVVNKECEAELALFALAEKWIRRQG